MYAIAPNGKKIVGTAEIVPGVARIYQDSFRWKVAARTVLEYARIGGTELDWDGQKTRTIDRGGAQLPVFVDEDGDEWTADQLVLKAA